MCCERGCNGVKRWWIMENWSSIPGPLAYSLRLTKTVRLESPLAYSLRPPKTVRLENLRHASSCDK
jgi:hypothetical protein